MAWMKISFTYRSAIDNFLERKKYNFDIEIEMNALPKNLTPLDGESSTTTGSKNTNPRQFLARQPACRGSMTIPSSYWLQAHVLYLKIQKSSALTNLNRDSGGQ